MDTNKLTQKSMEALQRAQALAVRSGHNAVDTEHLLAALMQDREGIVPRLIGRTAVRPEVLTARVEAALNAKAKVSGPEVRFCPSAPVYGRGQRRGWARFRYSHYPNRSR